MYVQIGSTLCTYHPDMHKNKFAQVLFFLTSLPISPKRLGLLEQKFAFKCIFPGFYRNLILKLDIITEAFKKSLCFGVSSNKRKSVHYHCQNIINISIFGIWTGIHICGVYLQKLLSKLFLEKVP